MMTELMEIITYPAPVLKAPAESVKKVTNELQTLIDRMAATMYAAPGIGLAANQVGVAKRVITYDLCPGTEDQELSVLINPEIVSGAGEFVYEEACLSVLDYSADVTRMQRICVRGLDRNGTPVEIEAEDLMAVCLQHEIDHLNGILFIDHISSLKRALYKKRLRKILKSQPSS
jgi:peptide deformylase